MLPAKGVLQYNGFAFGPYTETTSMKVRPQFDAAGRTVIYSLFTFGFKTVLTAPPGSANDAQVLAARQALTKSGGEFVYTGRGFADILINVGAVRDANWGPKPQELSFKPVGSDRACVLEWSLEVAVPDCPDAVFEGRVMELAYTVAFSRDAAGYSARTVSGYVKIPLTRPFPGSDRLTDSADAYRERLNPPIPEGYRRRWGPFKLDAAKTRLDFEFTDEEMGENVPPPGCVAATASHTVNSTVRGLTFWSSTLEATYTLEKGTDPAVALRAFFALLKSRQLHLADGLNRRPAAGAKIAESQSIVPVAFTMAQPDVYGPVVVKVSLTYTFAGSREAVLGHSGLWRPVPGSDWKKWSASLADGVHHPRGSARMTFAPGDDRLTDLCGPAAGGPLLPATTDLPQGELPNKPGDDVRGRLDIERPAFADLVSKAFPKPKKESSWVSYENQIYVEHDSGTVPLRILPGAALDAANDAMSKAKDFAGAVWDSLTGGPPAVTPDDVGRAVGGILQNDSSPVVAAVQRRARAFCYVYLRGRATRAGFEIPVPRLLDIDGITPTPCNRLDAGEGYTQTVGFAAGDTPLYKAQWNLRYFMDVTPTKFPTPPNPLLSGDA